MLSLLTALKKAGHEPILGSFRLPTDEPKAIESAADSLGISVWPVVARKGLDKDAARALARKALASNVDVIHCHGYKADILTALFVRPIFCRPIVATLHGWTATTPSQMRWWYAIVHRQMLRLFDGLAVVQRGMLTDRRIPRQVRRKMTVIDNGIDTSATIPTLQGSSNLVRFCRRGPTIGVVGRLSAEKGIDVLLEAFAMLLMKNPAVQLAIIGDGPLRASLEKQSDSLRLTQQVHFAGFVSGASTSLSALHCLVIPSVSEGLPMVLLEAMRAKIPIVATKVGGIPEALDDGRCGYLVPANDPAALCEALGETLTNEAMARARTLAAYDRLETRYSATAMVHRYLDFYARALRAK